MDLIYANANLIDQGVLIDYSFDMEYGTGDCTFECRVQSYNHVCEQDYLLYIEFTEYGGVIDRIESNTSSGEVVYAGRTWHGILNSFVITPPTGEAYRTFEGAAHEVLQEIVNMFGLGDLFEVEAQEDAVQITAFDVRYEHAYHAILRMLDENNAKLYMYWRNNRVNMGVLRAINYATNEEFDSSQTPFEVGYTFNNINHLVCLGQGNGEKRAVIHLFCDDGGNVMQYLKNPSVPPVQDSDYILDESRKVMIGREEITRIYDYPSAEITLNYLPLTTRPSNWNGTYTDYFEQGEDGTTEKPVYNKMTKKYKDEYHLQYNIPSDWNNHFNTYYKKSGSGESFTKVTGEVGYDLTPTQPEDWEANRNLYYIKTSDGKYQTVKDDEHIRFRAMKEKPKDWKSKYGSYYTYFWDGTQEEYRAVQPRIIYTYEKQTKIPTDWETNYNNYYVLLKAGTYKTGSGSSEKEVKYKGGYYTIREAVSMGKLTIKLDKKKEKALKSSWKKNKFYTRYDNRKPPKWRYGTTKATRFYKKIVTTSAPEWVANKYYAKHNRVPPKWEARKYYTKKEKVEQIPVFAPNKYFYEVQDRFAVMVEDALKELEELRDTSTLNIDLDVDSNFDVGDVIGAYDNVTKIEVAKPIIRKVIRIRKDIVSTEYKVD